MIRARRILICAYGSAVFLLLSATLVAGPLSAQESSGTLVLTIKDATTGKPVPGRLEIKGADGTYHVAQDALPASGDCSMGDPGSGPVDAAASVAKFFDRVAVSNP